MKTSWLQILSLTTLLTTHLASAHASDDDFTPAPITVPDGFVVEVAAAPPLVKHPMLAGFDDRGRLFIAETAGKNMSRQDLEKELPNFVRMIEDTDGDGVFDKSTIFADKLTYPMGALWHDGWLYVASSGAIWRFRDSDDDGVADVREQLVNEFGYTGNAADVHGCFLGPCGRIYWCEGRHGHEFRDDNGDILSKGKAARIFSMKPDGSDVQVHCGGGMDNPVEIDFTERGEMLGTVNILYRQRGDCLVHWVHGGVYPRHDQPQVTAEFKRTGDLLPPVINLGHVAVSGTMRYRSTHLGEDFQDNFFVTEFNTHKVVRTKLTRTGSTFAAEAIDFLSCSSSDFHPTDVLEDADGSLLVIDTGGWFLRGCPTSKIAKPNVYGAIYRIRRADAARAVDPRGTELDWARMTNGQAVNLLDDHRFSVRDRAIRVLASRGEKAVRVLRAATDSQIERKRRNAVWALSRIGSSQALATIRERLSDTSSGVRHAAAMSTGANADRRSVPQLIELLADSDPAVRRVAATALGKIKDIGSIPEVLATLSDDQLDRVQEHALIYSLIETGDRHITAAGLKARDPRTRRAALIALDQMDNGNLERAEVTALLATNDLALQRATIDVISRHPEWSEKVVDVVKQLLADEEPLDEQLQSSRTLLVAFAADEQVQQFVAEKLRSAERAIQLTLLDVIRDANLSAVPKLWEEPVATLLSAEHDEIIARAIATAERNASSAFVAPLRKIADDEKRSAALRIRALGATPDGRELTDETLQFIADQLLSETPVTQRLAAAAVIGSSRLTAEQLRRATKLVKAAGPLELSALLGAFEANSDNDVGRELITSLHDSPGLANLSPSLLDRLFRNSSEEIQKAAASLAEKLGATNEEQVQRLSALSDMAGGDPLRGAVVFQGQHTSCIACHQVQGKGGRIGPDLSTIGARRNTRDLLEAVLYPSSSLARGFESFGVVTTAGKVHTGLILSETTDAIQLRTTDQKEIIIRRGDIEELQSSSTSIMPKGLDSTISPDDLRDLIAFLSSLK